MKHLALIAIVVLGLSQQPTKAPEAKAAVKGNAQVADQANAGKDTDKPTVQTSPALNNNANKSTTDEELKTQRGLMWFTGALVVVSFLQFAALIWQACLFFRQTRIMDEHRVHLERLAIAASDNAKAAKEGAEAASKNAEFSKLNAVATEKSADAAKISADIAASVSIPTLKISQFRISTVNASVSSNVAFFRRPQFEITVKNWGQTPVFLWSWTLKMTCEDLPEMPVYSGIASGMPLEKQVIPGGGSFTLPVVGFPYQHDFSVDDARAVSEQNKSFTVYGYICYGDMFGNPLRRMKFCEVLLNIFGDLNFQWTELFSDPPYVGTDLYPIRQKNEAEKAN